MYVPFAKRLLPGILALGIAASGANLAAATASASSTTTSTTKPVTTTVKTGTTCTKHHQTVKVGSTTLVCKQVKVWEWEKKG